MNKLITGSINWELLYYYFNSLRRYPGPGTLLFAASLNSVSFTNFSRSFVSGSITYRILENNWLIASYIYISVGMFMSPHASSLTSSHRVSQALSFCFFISDISLSFVVLYCASRSFWLSTLTGFCRDCPLWFRPILVT